MGGRNKAIRSARCRFCREGVGKVDYKEYESLQKVMTAQGRLFSRKRSGNCSYHQRSVQQAVKRGRFLGLLRYV